MAAVTLYDGTTGEPVRGNATAPLAPVVSADDHSGVSFALDPRSGRALVQFVTDPGNRRLVAGCELADGDGLQDLNRAIQERITATDYSLARPGTVPPHLNVFHYLAAPEPASPDAELRGHLVATDDPIAVGVPSAAEAVSVAAFFRERAPWKVVAVHSADATVSTDDADVTVVVDDEFDAVTSLGRDERWVDADVAPDDPRDGADVAAATTANVPDAATVGEDEGGTPGDEQPVLRIYDGATGELEYDSRRSGDVPATVSEDVKRIHRDGLALYVDPTAGVLRAILRARGAEIDTQFVVEYDQYGPDEDVLASFAGELAERVDDLGVEFSVVVAGEEVDYDQLTGAAARRPEALGERDVERLRRTDRPLDFAAPGGTAAFELATFLRGHLGDGRSMAICAAGRTDDLAATDVVVTPDPDCETIEPRGETATVLADRRLQEGLTDVRAAIDAMIGRVDEVTGTIEARQRVFAAALSGRALARRGLTVVPVDDRPIGRRRRQARYLMLYGLLLAGLAGGVHTGQFDPLAALLSDTYWFRIGPVAGTHLAAFQLTYAVDGGVVVGGSLAVIVVGAYWLFGYPLGPLAAARSLAGTVRRQVTGGVGNGTVPSTVRSLADPIQASFEDLAVAYERLADSEGTTASQADDFGAFLEQQLLAQPVVPRVSLVRRSTRWRQLLVGVVTGALVGTVSAAAILVALRFAVHAVQRDPTLAPRALLGVAALVLLASVVKGVAILYGGGRPPRWSTAR